MTQKTNELIDKPESEEKFMQIVRSSPNAIVMTDPLGKIVLINPQTEKLFKYSPQQLIGKNIETLIPERFRHGHVKLRNHFMTEPETRPMGTGRDLYALRSDNTEVPVEIGLAPVHTSKGINILCTIVDISIRKESEARLREYQSNLETLINEKIAETKRVSNFLDSIVDNIPDMVFVKEAKTLKFVRFNKAGEELLGYHRDILIGKSDYDFFPKAQADFFTEKDRAVFKEGKVLDIPEEQILTRVKGPRVLHTKKIPMLDAEGNPEYLLGISEDITDKKNAERLMLQLSQEQAARDEAQKNVKLRDDFISIASHELKTPLTALKLQFQIIPKMLQNVSFPGEDKFFELFENSLRQLDQFVRLVDELLDVSRIGAGGLVLDVQPVNLSTAVSQILNLYQNNLKAAGCVVTTNLDPKAEGLWDATRIEQAIVNLLTNSMKYGAGKPIEITTKVLGNSCQLIIQDHGIGIAKDNQSKIFERFERAAPITRYGGLGLGLFITRQIVQAHGGTIQVESELGKGSTFIVEIPKQIPGTSDSKY